MTAVGKAHAENLVAGREQGKINGKICLRAAVRLNICVLRAEKLLCALDSDIFNDVNAFAAAVITLAGIALGIFVCQRRAHCRKHCGGDKIFACYKFDSSALAGKLHAYCLTYFGVVAFQKFNIFVYHRVLPPVNIILHIIIP